MKRSIVLLAFVCVLCLSASLSIAKEVTPGAISAPEVTLIGAETVDTGSLGSPFQAGVETGGAVGALHVDCNDPDIFCGAKCDSACWPGVGCVCWCTQGTPQDVCVISACHC